MKNLLPLLLAILFTLLSGGMDAMGFTHSARVWLGERFIWQEALRSLLWFQGGVCTFWMATRYLGQVGVTSTEVQTLFWFGVTIVGVALLSRQFLKWASIDQIVAGVVLLGLIWLVYRTGN